MAFGDRILVQARNSSVQIEGLAAAELNRNLGDYLPPNYNVRKMAEAYGRYARTRSNTHDEYMLLRSTFTETKSKSHQVFSSVLASHVPTEKYALNRSLFQGDDHNEIIRGAVRSLQKKGMWKARFRVPPEIVESLKGKILGRMTDIHGDVIERMMTGAPDAPLQIKSNFKWITSFEEMYQIASDPLLLTIVHRYMGVPPIFDVPVSFINSVAPSSEKGLSDTAQLYHHDMYRLGFVKLFIYLTDVGPGSGPHTMIPGTHRERPDALWADGRHTDESVAAHGLLDKEARITGPAGTVFLVDTSALHKGSHPTEEARLIAQVQYANSLFGHPIPEAERPFTAARKSDDPEIQEAGVLVKKYAERTGVRFMQGLI
ncbi:MAG: hypothetical protein ACI8U3_001180 [Brevundimonas sp.]|jgi:hypothetical protein|uniref:phytanoyl-CoA dioxygenase family protein n=1 Tax=Brevundimonas sp. TaxID=1871086 RepID=UPI0039E5D1D7